MRTKVIIFRNARQQRLEATIHRPVEPNGAGVVVCHGMLSSRESPKHAGLCENLARRGFISMRFDFAGRGESDGRTEEITYDGQVEDLEAALEVIQRDTDEIGLVGSSMGGAVAILTAAKRDDVKCVVGIAAVGRPGTILERLVVEPERVERWRSQGVLDIEGYSLGWCLVQSARKVDVVGAARALACPLLLIHGERDDIVPIEQAMELRAAARESQLQVISSGDHLLHRSEDQRFLEESVGDFMALHLA